MALNVRRTLIDHLKARRLAEQASTQQNKFRDVLKDWLLANGEVEDPENGSLFYRFAEQPIPDEADETKVVVGIKAEKRTRQLFDEDAAWDLIKKHKVQDKVVTTVTTEVINEDALLGLAFAGELPDEEVQALYTESDPTWAFKVLRENAG